MPPRKCDHEILSTCALGGTGEPYLCTGRRHHSITALYVRSIYGFGENSVLQLRLSVRMYTVTQTQWTSFGVDLISNAPTIEQYAFIPPPRVCRSASVYVQEASSHHKEPLQDPYYLKITSNTSNTKYST